MPEKDIRDISFRSRVIASEPTGKAVEFLKGRQRDDEKHKFLTAIRAFWAPYGCEQEELTEVALQSILELSEQILQIALLADLPVDQLNFKSQVLQLIQQTKANTKANQGGLALTQSRSLTQTVSATPTSVTDAEISSNGAGGETVIPDTVKPPGGKRRSLFTD